MEQGPTERSIIEAAVKRRQPLPDVIRDAPQLLPGLEQFFQAFMELHTCRPPALMQVEKVPWTAIDAYGRRYEYEGEDFDRLLLLVRAMDDAYIEWCRAKQPKPEG